MNGRPSYLRVVVTARCSLACGYCHREGDPAGGQAGGLDSEELSRLLRVAVGQGIHKLKFLGGEPLLRADLPEQIARLRRLERDLDLSMITAGATSVDRLEACFAAGLSRANLSIHGWSVQAFAERTARGERAWSRRNAVLERLLHHGRFLKLNFVYRGPQDQADLAVLLDWAAGQPVVVGVLDDLGDPDLGPQAVQQALVQVRGRPALVRAEPDPHSLPTARLRWRDGLEVEVKDHHLGEVAPWQACLDCPVRARCREGIHALRLSHDGFLRPCMDRPDLRLDLRGALRAHGPGAAGMAWARAVRSWQRPTSPSFEPFPTHEEVA